MNNDQVSKFLPIWVWVIVIIQVALVLFFSAVKATAQWLMYCMVHNIEE
jgi:hypothetical protein